MAHEVPTILASPAMYVPLNQRTQSPFSSSQIPEPPATPSRLPTPSKRAIDPTAGSDASRRRSLLPGLRKPALSTKLDGDAGDAAATTAPATRDTTAAGAEKRNSRVISRAPGVGRRPADAGVKSSMPPPAVPASGLGRTQSLRKPGATGPTRTASLRSNANATSSSSSLAKGSATGLPARGAPDRGSRPGSATSTRSTASGASHSTALKSTSTSSTRHRDGPSPPDPEPSKLGRPAFSTLQQHFSPAKPSKTLALKKPTAAFLAATAPPPSPALPTETILLQTSLLQVHLLLGAGPVTTAQWEASAETALRAKFEEVATAHGSMRQDQQEIQELVNLHALAGWQDGGGGLAEKVQRLGELLGEARGMADEEGRFARHVAMFEEWMAGVEEVWARREGESVGSEELEVAEGLGERWRTENAALGRKMAVLVREAELLGQPEEGSSVSAIVTAVRDLIKGMNDEVGLLRRLEMDVVKGEERWVEEGLGDIAGNIELKLEAREARGHEAWRMLRAGTAPLKDAARCEAKSKEQDRTGWC
ncbi:hypothetical protein K490DRAFT_58184 [Saccharata proteae CBS 121410]|uniref:Uncharacterized protein n=1 Tax=Saccharata proteae CBS 121410 TaxID=1314787 RepID=A0A9P4LVQ5_9PEZI|nr:hypothetical protein K490DRAFT_58184 [Saccharata proteae CBS 121410]